MRVRVNQETNTIKVIPDSKQEDGFLDKWLKESTKGNAKITHTQDNTRWKTDFPEVVVTVRDMLREEGFGQEIDLSEKNIFTVEPIQSVDKKAKSKAKIATQYIGFAEGITGSSTALYAKQIEEQSNKPKTLKEYADKTSARFINTKEVLRKDDIEYYNDRVNDLIQGRLQYAIFAIEDLNNRQYLPFINKLKENGFKNVEGMEWVLSKDGKNPKTEYEKLSNNNIVNSGNYSSNDVIFVSIGGKRGNEVIRKAQQDRTIREAIKALEAGATLITDNAAYVESNSYNEGEKRLAANLKAKGYVYSETTEDGNVLGVWHKVNTQTTTQQKQEAQQLYSQYLDSLNTTELYSKLGDKTESGNVKVVKDIFANKDNKDVITAFRVDKKLGLLESFKKYNAIGNPINWQGFKPRFEGDNATIAFMDWFLGKDYTDLEQEYRQEILNNLDNLKGKIIEYYKELGRPSHATALDYLINRYDWNSTPNIQITPEQKQEAQQLYSEYLEQNPNGNIEGFKQWNNRQQQVSELFIIFFTSMRR